MTSWYFLRKTSLTIYSKIHPVCILLHRQELYCADIAWDFEIPGRVVYNYFCIHYPLLRNADCIRKCCTSASCEPKGQPASG